MEMIALNRRQLRLHCHLRHRRPSSVVRRPRYQALESTESGKVSVQPRIDIPLTVEESTRMLRFKKELIATILDAVVFQRAGTLPYATALIIPPHQIQTLHSRKMWMG